MEPKYTLTLSFDVKQEEKQNKEILALAFDEGKDSTVLGCKLTLSSLNIKKEMYKPGYIEAELQASPKGDGSTSGISNINIDDFNSLLGTKVNLNDGFQDIAQNYIIFDFIPEYKANGDQTSLYIKLNIYSPEKILSFKKYSKCYVAKKLGADIFKEIAKKYSDVITNPSIKHQQHLSLKDSADNQTEFIQPYLVQYNESALDFLTRIANRCGEFMFYEDNTWYLGLNIGKDVNSKSIENYNSLSFHQFKDRDIDTYWANNYIGEEDEEKEKEEQKKAGTLAYEGPADENLFTYPKKEASYGKSLGENYNFNDPSFYFENLTSWMKEDDASSILATVTIDLAKNAITTGTHYEEKTKKWNDDNFEPYKNSTEQCGKNKESTIVSPFSNYNAIQYSNFYMSIKEREQSVERKAIHIDLGTNYQSLKLGDIINVLNGKKYIINKIAITCNKKAVTNGNGETENKQYTTFDIDAIPILKIEENEQCYPLPIKDSIIKKVESQTAIVTSTNDPLGLGRIQIRYPWQEKVSGPSSPWIRIAAPFTSKDAAIKFMPQKGDEIMVGYEYGDIERPFMIGSLASTENNGDSENNYIIKSPNGHYIKFSNPKNWKGALKSFSPAIDTWLTYLPSSADKINLKEQGKEFAGGITMSDTYGFYKISMSTEKRSVSIASSLGNVKIDALTGITISAPNGNVKIVGKNVEISAGNNLKITSGTNVKKRKAYENFGHSFKANFFGGVVDEVKSLTQVVDMSLIRTIAEAFLKPIGGTMLIKSNRFLRLEAGKGTTKLPNTAFKKNSKHESDNINDKIIELRVKDTLNATIRLQDYFIDRYKNVNERLESAQTEYSNKLNDLINIVQIDTNTKLKYDNTEINSNDIEAKIETVEDIIAKAFEDSSTSAQSYEKIDKLTNDNNPGFAEAKSSLIAQAENLFQIIKDYLEDVKEKNKDVIIKNRISISDTDFVGSQITIPQYRNDIYNDLIEISKLIQKEVNNFVLYKDKKVDQNYKTATFTPKGKRRILYDVLQELKKKEFILIQNDGGFLNLMSSWAEDQGRNLAEVDDPESVCKDEESWKDFLDCIKLYDKDEDNTKKGNTKLFGTGVLKALKHGFDWENLGTGWKENNILHPQVEGEILLSDTEGNTCNIKGDVIHKTSCSPLKEAIGILKKI